MSRSVGLAYAVTGAAIASAVIAITASTAGLFDSGQATTASAAFEAGAAPAFANQSTGDPAAAGVGASAEGTRYRYVDEPTGTRRSHEEHERFERSGPGNDDD